jgi:hypothetical protein
MRIVEGNYKVASGEFCFEASSYTIHVTKSPDHCSSYLSPVGQVIVYEGGGWYISSRRNSKHKVRRENFRT